MATHAHIPRENKTCSPTEVLYPNLQPRTKQHPTDLHKANLFTFTQTNKRQATDQPKRMVEREVHLECLGASGAPRLKKRRDYNVKVAFRGFPLVFVFSWKFLTPIQLKLCKTQTGCRYRAL